MSDPKWYVLVAARVLERGAKRTGDASLARLAEELRKRVESEKRSGSGDPLDILDQVLDQALKPLEELLDRLDRLL